MLNGGGIAPPLGPLDLGDNEPCGIEISPESHTGKGKGWGFGTGQRRSFLSPGKTVHPVLTT